MKLTTEQMNEIKKILDINDSEHVHFSFVSSGFNVRIKQRSKAENKKPFIEILKESGVDISYCRKCLKTTQHHGIVIHAHHIIPKSAGGKDDPENGLPLCFECHMNLHDKIWHIADIVKLSVLEFLRKKYKVRYGIKYNEKE